MAALGLALGLVGCGPDNGPRRVVVYCSAAPEAAGAILRDYAWTSGVEVEPKLGDGAAGVVRLLIQESPRPRCDLFWSGEILEMIRLRRKGMLASWSPPDVAGIPANLRSKDGTWYGLAPRARVFVVNTNLVAEADRPGGLADLVAPRWKGHAVIASPLSGSTATHFACLFSAWGEEKARAFLADLKRNEVGIVPGNREVAEAVASGRFAFGLTDIGEALAAIEAGGPATIVHPDQEDGEVGTLFLADALAIPKGAPHPAEAEALGNALLSPEVAKKLARATSSDPTPRSMEVDFEAVANIRDAAAARLAVEFARP